MRSYRFSADKTYLVVPQLEREGLFHFFGTRRLADAAALGFPGRVCGARQVHGDHVCHIDGDAPSPSDAQGYAQGDEGDALTTDRADVLITVVTADCVPILLFDPTRKAVSAVHAGWRGTLLGIVKKAVGEMGRHFGSQPRDLIAAIGPSIGRCCCEVGPDVWENVDSAHRDSVVVRKAGEKGMLDLPRLNALQMGEAGLLPAQIALCGFCTVCAPELFHSYRRDGKTGRMISGMGILS